MLDKVSMYLKNQCNFGLKDSLLLAISGGIDSVVMLHIINALKIDVGILHCNYQLRGEESDKDQRLVAQLAADYGIPFFVKIFDTPKIVENSNESIQMIARKLRYDWFEEIRKENNFHAIATAHHMNDQIETVLFNLAKGTGIAGLRGILPRNNKIIRPLLFLSREEIVKYANDNKLLHREDASNASTKYARNKIRLKVVPSLKEINPNLEKTFKKTRNHVLDSEKLSQFAINQQIRSLIEKRGEDCFISILKLKNKTVAPKTVLWTFVKDFGFNETQVENLFEALEGNDKKEFFSKTHRLLKDKKFLILSDLEHLNTSKIHLVKEDARKVRLKDFKIIIKKVDIKKYEQEYNENIAGLDFDKLEFPLIIRTRKDGDYFYPLGMEKANGKPGKKKLKKYFSDTKKTAFERENALILQDNKDRIVWIIGDRLDDRFKVKESTKNVFRMRLKKGK